MQWDSQAPWDKQREEKGGARGPPTLAESCGNQQELWVTLACRHLDGVSISVPQPQLACQCKEPSSPQTNEPVCTVHSVESIALPSSVHWLFRSFINAKITKSAQIRGYLMN